MGKLGRYMELPIDVVVLENSQLDLTMHKRV